MSRDFNHLRDSFSYRPDIDGLRALAVLPVLLFHAGLGFPGGFVGVDIFFVISGFLITSIIIREIIDDRFTYRNFWERRIRRIFPPAMLVTLVTVIVGAWALLPETYAALGKAAIAQLLMGANFYFWQQDGYFAGPSDLEPLLHMWSLAVEEQFYLLFPFLLVLLCKRGAGLTYKLLVALTLASFAWSLYGVVHFQMATFYLLPARAWELFLGALLALLPLPVLRSTVGRSLLAVVGLALIVASFFLYGPSTPFPGLAALPPCLGTALLIYAHQSGSSPIAKVLCLSPVVFIGKISYSLYLWHWPLLVYGRHFSIHEMSLTMRVSLLVAAFVLSVLTWMFVETPFRKRRFGKERKQLFRFFGIATVVLAGAFTFLYKSDGLPVRFQGDNARFAEAHAELTGGADLKRDFTDLPLFLPESKNEPSPVLLWGDSHARVMVPLFQHLCTKLETNAYYACRSGTPALLDANFLPGNDRLAPMNDRIVEALDRTGIKTVVLVARWSDYFHRGEGSRKDRLTDRENDERPSRVVFQDSLKKTIETMKKRGVRVFIMKQVPQQFRQPPSALWMAERFGYDPSKTGVTVAAHLAHQKETNKVLDTMAGEGVTILDPLPLLSHDNGFTKVHEGQEIFYSDDNHLSKAGALALEELFTGILKGKQSP